MNSFTGHCLIVIPSLARWVSDFNVVSSYLADNGWNIEILFPDERGHRKGWASEETMKKAAASLHPALTTRPLRITTRPVKPSIWDSFITFCIAASEARKRDKLFILWSAFGLILFGPWVRLFNRNCLYLVTGLGTQFTQRRQGTLKLKLTCLLYRFLFSSDSAMVIVHNKEDKQELVEKTRVAPQRVFVTGGCGVDPDDYEFDPEPITFPEKPVIIVPSRILRDKGSLEAAEASSILTQRGIKHRMHFTSDLWFGREDSITEAELKQAESYPDVEFIGFQKDMLEVYRSADVVCIPSWYREGLQTALLEASAAGVPIVACDNIGVRDFIRPSVDALVAKPRNAKSLADKLEELLRNPKEADRLRKSARTRLLGGFTSNHMLDVTTRVLAELDPRVKPSSASTSEGPQSST